MDQNQPNFISDGTSILTELKLELDMDTNLTPNIGSTSNFTKASPAQDALSELFDLPVPAPEDSVSNDFMSNDANRWV